MKTSRIFEAADQKGGTGILARPSAVTLGDAQFSGVFRYDGDLIYQVSRGGTFAPDRQDAMNRSFPMAPSRGNVTAQAILERRTHHANPVQPPPPPPKICW